MKPKRSITIYTDGGSKPNPGPGGWGAVLIAENGEIQKLSGNNPRTTNNGMELTAAIEALRALEQPHQVTLYTDSQYLRRGITGWLYGWRKNNWMTKKGTPVQNRELWQALYAETLRHEISWQWVKGHAGNQYNECVDRLATTARQVLQAPKAPTPKRVERAFTVEYEIALRVSVPKASGTGGWAVRIAEVATDEMTTYTGREAKTTSNRLILVAAQEALQRLPNEARVRVFCPDDYLRNGMTTWISGWKKRGWRSKSGSPVKHRDMWQTLEQESNQRTVQWVAEREKGPLLWARDLAKRAAEEVR